MPDAFFYGFGENLEILTYLCWPALLLLGAAFAMSASDRVEAGMGSAP